MQKTTTRKIKEEEIKKRKEGAPSVPVSLWCHAHTIFTALQERGDGEEGEKKGKRHKHRKKSKKTKHDKKRARSDPQGEAAAPAAQAPAAAAAAPKEAAQSAFTTKLLQSAASAAERLAGGEVQAAIAAHERMQSAAGAAAVDWRKKKRLERELAALHKMVETGASIQAEQAAARTQMAQFRVAFGLASSEEAPSAAEAAAVASSEAALRAEAARRRVQAEQLERARRAPIGPCLPPPSYMGNYDPIRAGSSAPVIKRHGPNGEPL